MTYEEFASDVRLLSDRIKHSGLTFDAIVGVARGGWIPSRLLSQNLGVKRLYSFGVTYGDAQRTQLVAYDRPASELNGKKLLLVEDFLESGRSLAFAKQELEIAGNEVRTVAIRHLPRSVIAPDFTLGEVEAIPSLPWD